MSGSSSTIITGTGKLKLLFGILKTYIKLHSTVACS